MSRSLVPVGSLAVLLASSVAAAQPAAAPPPPPGYPSQAPVEPDRRGFTAELSLGWGSTSVSPDSGEGDSFSGLSGLNVGLGGWVSPKTAITARIAGTQFEQFDISFIAAFFGVSVQQMVSDQAWLGGGLGFGILTTDQDDVDPDSGLGLDLRAGYNFYQSRKNAFNVQLEITPGFYDGGRVTGIGLQIGWQSL